jgi:hypothetical protein
MLNKPQAPTSSEALDTDRPASGTADTPKPSLRRRLERLFSDYGSVAVVTYFGIFFCTWGGFAAAIALGVEVEGAAAGASTLFGAWLATKVTQPIRIGATIVATPFAARMWHRVRPRRARVVAVSEPLRDQD